MGSERGGRRDWPAPGAGGSRRKQALFADTEDRIQKLPDEIEVGDLVWDGFDGFEVAEVIHSTDGTVPVVEMRSATGDSWRVRGEGGTTIAVVKDKESLIERSSWDSFEDDEEFDDEEDED